MPVISATEARSSTPWAGLGTLVVDSGRHLFTIQAKRGNEIRTLHRVERIEHGDLTPEMLHRPFTPRELSALRNHFQNASLEAWGNGYVIAWEWSPDSAPRG